MSEFVVNPFEDNVYFDTSSFVSAVSIAINALDTVLDENMKNHPLKEQREMAKNYRNIGLGIMGLYDMLVKMGMPYGSKDSIEFVDSLMSLMFRISVIASSNIASVKGAFPQYSDSVLTSKIIRNHFTDEELRSLGIIENGLRNCSLLSVAPTGSLGTMLDISTGCEPAFAISYKRKTESLHKNVEKYYTVYCGIAKEYMDKFGDEREDMQLPPTFITSADINWKDRIDMQSVMQKHIDTAISSTVNLPHDISVDEIEQLYLYAWKKGLKGVTIFRDGCKRVGILTTDNTAPNSENNNENTSTNKDKLERGMIIKADDNCVGKKRTLHTGCGTLHCEAFFDPDTGELLETYFSKGSSGGCNNFMIGLSRMISLSARGGVDIYSIVDQLKSSGTCPSYAVRRATKRDTSAGSSCPVAIGNALIDMYEEFHRELFDDDDDKQDLKTVVKESDIKKVKNNESNSKTVKCPECGGDLVFEGGCNSCKNCGYSKCD